MTLLALEHVAKRHRHGAGQRVVLSDVCLEMEQGELVAIWGERLSGRSTLLRVAAGIESADDGVVRFAGADVRARGHEVLGGGVGWCHRPSAGPEGRGVLEEMLVGQLARGVPAPVARAQARHALEEAGASHCLAMELRQLDTGEAVRVAIARALVLRPELLVIDEPVKGVDLLERDGILALLRRLADEGTAVLTSTGDATALAGVDRALSLTDGRLRGMLRPRLAEVLPLHQRACA